MFELVATVDEILQVRGVLVAGEFTADGCVVEYRSVIYVSRQWAETMAQFCATATKNWADLGPKLRGKLHVYAGDGDDYFLNNAVRRLDAERAEWTRMTGIMQALLGEEGS